MIVISVAGLNIGIDNKYDFIKNLASDYTVSSEKIDFTVSCDESDIAAEAEMSEGEYPLGYLESIAVYRKIAERLPEYGAFVFHGAVLAFGGNAYAFTARSGVGKTTHIGLWLKEFGSEVHILNGDKPIIRMIDGIPYACGTPWRGKENFGVPEMLPLKAVSFIGRAAENSAREISVGDALMRFVSQIYVPRSEKTAPLALMTANRVISSVGLFELFVNMDASAAHVARDAITADAN